MSLQQVSELLDQLVRERGEDAKAGRAWVPDAVALLTIARRAIDGASAAIASSKVPAVRDSYRQLGRLSQMVLVERDTLDTLLSRAGTVSVQVSVHAHCFLQLDSGAHVEGYGLREDQIEDTRRGGAKVTGTPEQIEKLAGFLDPALVDGTDIDARSKRMIRLDRQRLLDAAIVARKGA